MANPTVVVAPEVVTLAEDLQQGACIEVYYLDAHGTPQRTTVAPAWASEEGIRVELRPHLVVTQQTCDPESGDYGTETLEIPLERVLIADVSQEDQYGEQPYETYLQARWVHAPHGTLLRLRT